MKPFLALSIFKEKENKADWVHQSNTYIFNRITAQPQQNHPSTFDKLLWKYIINCGYSGNLGHSKQNI